MRQRSHALAALSIGGLAALLGAPARAGDAPEEKAQAPVATADHVVMVPRAGVPVSGWPLDPSAAGGCALLRDDGAIVIVPTQPAPEIRSVDPRPVTDVPSGALAAGLAHAEPGVRDRCEELLREQGEPGLKHLGAAFDSDAVEANRRALSILARQAAKFPKAAAAWLPRVRNRLDAADEQVRKAALRAFAALGAEDAGDRCLEALRDDESVHVRHEAIVQLGRRQDLRAVDALLEHLASCEERSLRLVTFDALRRLTGKGFGRDEQQWRNWWANHRAELLPESAR
jgi:hypothetical protein